MANYAFTKYCVEGKKESLTKIADAINQGDGYASSAYEKLGVKYTDNGRAEWETGAVVEEKDGISVLRFTEAYPWGRGEILEELLGELYPDEPFAIYYRSEVFEDEIHETNDEEGKYFPEKYYVHFYDKEEDLQEEYCLNEQVVVALFRQFYPEVAEYITIAQLNEQYGYETNEDVAFVCYEIEGASGITANTIKQIVETIMAGQ